MFKIRYAIVILMILAMFFLAMVLAGKFMTANSAFT